MIQRFKPPYSAKHYLVELVLGLCVLFGVYLIIAWSSYSAFDNAWTVASPQQDTLNKAGHFGAMCIDILFALFGSLANFLPFALVISAILLLRNRWQDNFSKSRVLVRLFGFALLLCGLTALASLLLSNSEIHLAGGVLGAFIVKHLYPTLGMFGTFMVAFCAAVVGFILSAGMSLVMLLLSGYHWLTAKYDDEEPQPRELDPLFMPSSEEPAPIAVKSPEELAELEPIEVKSAVALKPLPPIESPTVLAEPEEMPDFSHTTVIEAPELPAVSIPTIRSMNEIAQNVSKETREEPKDDLFDLTLPDELLTQNQSAVERDDDEALFDPVQAQLAKAFAEQERQKAQELAERAKALGAEEELAKIQAHAQKQPPQYQDYAAHGTLIHPLLQSSMPSKKAKPSTALPTLDLLEPMKTQSLSVDKSEIHAASARIEQQLANFRVKAQVKDVLVGPVVTRYELELEPGVKASKVSGLDSDLARALMFSAIRIAEVIPGKPYIGIETPNKHRQTVSLREVFDSREFRESKALLPMALGKDISGEPVVVDLAKMPHLLVAGATGSGKSVGVNSMILSLLYKRKPEDVRMIMIDPKVVELSIYQDIPHLLTPVVTDMKKAANALRWCVDEMERRYLLLSALYVRNIEGFNEKIKQAEQMQMPIPNPIWKPRDSMDNAPPPLEKMSYIVVVVDEFADLMMVAGKQVEEQIARLAQKARAVGIHLILATQRPSVDVITGLIKANVPSRIAFTVASKIDSRTILDTNGAEALLGRGDMLYAGPGTSELVRIHGAFMTDSDVQSVADDWRARGTPQYLDEITISQDDEETQSAVGGSDDELDELFDTVVEFVLNTGTISISSIQRNFKLGFNRAARIVDQMEAQGIVSAPTNGKREILAPRNDF
ncbi:DNA translocase FtsK 4TM domain-containing protein [Pasteurellaceae bacterium TAE3-ERU1]|nr:DNA translocase FtsK 4TM domain-containing protein [Pasteurellaceae bacterium TAE3-ERU1]